MKIIEKYSKQYKLFAAIFISAFTAYILWIVESWWGKTAISTAITSGIIGILSFIVGNTLENLMEKSKTIRASLLGSDFIEGYWYDFDEENSSSMALFSIEFKEGSYRVEGRDYKLDGEGFASWHSESTSYNDHKLYVIYESRIQVNKSDFRKEAGTLILNFTKPYDCYSGFYFDDSKAVRRYIKGKKVNIETLDRYDNFKNSELQAEFVVETLRLKNESILKVS